MQLKEIYAQSVHDKRGLEDENRQLRGLLRMNGIQHSGGDQTSTLGYDTNPTASSSSPSTSNFGYSTSQQRLSPARTQGSMGNSPSYGSAEYLRSHGNLSTREYIASPGYIGPMLGSQSGLQETQMQLQQQQTNMQPTPEQILNYDQLGVEFVLESVPQESQARGYSSVPLHSVPSQTFPSYNPRSR